MSEHEAEVAVPSEEQLQAARDSTPGRVEDDLTFETDEGEAPLTPDTPEESLLGTPVREEDSPQEAVEEAAEAPTQESEHEAVSPEGQGAVDEDHDPS